MLAPLVERFNALLFTINSLPRRRPMRRRPALPFRRCGRNCSRSGRGRLRREGGRGFIGLGRMGSAIAARVLSGDHDLLVFNRHPREGGGPRSNGGQGCRLDRGRTKCSLNVQTTFLPLPNHFFHSAAHPALLGGKLQRTQSQSARSTWYRRLCRTWTRPAPDSGKRKSWWTADAPTIS